MLHMGGYGGYVWPAYGISAVVLALVLLASVLAARKNEAELEQLQILRRANRRTAAGESEE
jgi:heme exporter protein D